MIEELEAAWRRAFPKRAGGAAAALGGFHYQFHSTLRDATRAWLVDNSSIAPIVEKLSDLAHRRTDGTWTITQVKRTGSSGSLAKSLAELWTIEDTARKAVPGFREKLVYEVRCAQWQLKDAEGILGRWKPPEGDSDVKSVDDFLGRVRITTDPHPLDDLVVILANDVGCADPLRWIHEWTGELMQATAHSTSEDVGRRLFSSLAKEKASLGPPTGVRAVPADLREPCEVRRGDYLVGEQPRLRHLQEGFFAPRDWLSRPAAEAFRVWLESDPFREDRSWRLPVFWIAGRSGCGKSVLLLQVIARLASQAVGPLLWIGNGRKFLSDAMSWSYRAFSFLGHQPIVVIDDPYAPGEQGDAEIWRDALSVLDAARDESEVIPIVLACGPTEQALSLGRDFQRDVNVEIWPLDEALDQENLDSLLRWFQGRTGRLPPKVGRGDILMVQRFFEWRTGERLDQFASRFRSRIEALDSAGGLATLVASTLAINRLYAGLPQGALESLADTERDALDRLLAEHHLVVDQHRGRPGLWLAHPHLADALFCGWYASPSSHEARGALREGVLSCLKFGGTPGEQTAGLWAIWRALHASPGDPVASRVKPEDLAPVLSEVYRSWIEKTSQLLLPHAPIWIHLTQDVTDLQMNGPPQVPVGIGGSSLRPPQLRKIIADRVPG